MSEQGEQKNRCNRPGRKRFTRKKLCFLLVAALVILAVLLFYAANKYYTPNLNELLARAKLVRLPGSTKNLQVDTRPEMENDRAIPNRSILFVQFQAEPNDIDDFIANSPSIDEDSFHPLSPLDDRDQVPTWFLTDQSTSGRVYRLKEKDIEGEVAVNDDSNTIYIAAYYVANPQIRDTQDFLENLKDDSEEFIEDLYHEVKDALGY